MSRDVQDVHVVCWVSIAAVLGAVFVAGAVAGFLLGVMV